MKKTYADLCVERAKLNRDTISLIISVLEDSNSNIDDIRQYTNDIYELRFSAESELARRLKEACDKLRAYAEGSRRLPSPLLAEMFDNLAKKLEQIPGEE